MGAQGHIDRDALGWLGTILAGIPEDDIHSVVGSSDSYVTKGSSSSVMAEFIDPCLKQIEQKGRTLEAFAVYCRYVWHQITIEGYGAVKTSRLADRVHELFSANGENMPTAMLQSQWDLLQLDWLFRFALLNGPGLEEMGGTILSADELEARTNKVMDLLSTTIGQQRVYMHSELQVAAAMRVGDFDRADTLYLKNKLRKEFIAQIGSDHRVDLAAMHGAFYRGMPRLLRLPSWSWGD
jgi:hypothetical protein